MKCEKTSRIFAIIACLASRKVAGFFLSFPFVSCPSPLDVSVPPFFLFDAPGSEKNIIVWVMFWSSLALPLTCLASVISSSIVAYKTANYKKALYIALLPCVVIAVLVVSLILLEVVCQGLFSCGYS